MRSREGHEHPLNHRAREPAYLKSTALGGLKRVTATAGDTRDMHDRSARSETGIGTLLLCVEVSRSAWTSNRHNPQ